MKKLLYDESKISSIVEYAQRLENKSVDEVNLEQGSFAGIIQQKQNIEADSNKKNKGGFGNFLEYAYFGKKNDNKSQADFPLANLELKTSPLKTLSNYEVRVKERLVLNHFTFTDIDKENFETSHFKEKNENILLVFYHHNSKVFFGELRIQLADLWQCFKEDEAQLKADWQTIVDKVHEGKAHEISEADTLYLGACTKGASAESSMQIQPHSDIKARGRALCFKTCYINHIFQVLQHRKENGRAFETRILSKNERFEDKIKSLFKPYLKMTADEICNLRGEKYNPQNKSRYADIARRILGLKKTEDNLYEFNASGIQLKTIRVEPNGSSRESLSFKNVDFCGIVDEEWEESDFYSAITSKFIFVLFKHDSKDEEFYLDKVVFWQIPETDYDIFRKVWEDTRNKVLKGDYEHFVKISENHVSHIRPKGRNASDLMYTPQRTYEKKKCFWINQEYIQKNVLDKIYKGKL